MLREKRISVLMDCKIQRLTGLNKLEGIYFLKKQADGTYSDSEYYINPSIVIAENGVGEPKINLKQILTPG